MQVARSSDSGKRVSNAWAICPQVGNNTSKEVLIPDETPGTYVPEVKVEDPLAPLDITVGYDLRAMSNGARA